MLTVPVAPIPFRLRLGVAGPRTLRYPEKTREAVRLALTTELPELCPQIRKNKRDLPIAYSVISMLAEGADQLVMREVKAWKPEAWQEALIPYSVTQYQEEYAAGPTRETFLALLRSCDRVFGMQEELEILEGREEIDAAFDDAMRELVESCDVLIVLSDPLASGSFTAKAVKYANEVGRPMLTVNAGDPDQRIVRTPEDRKVKFEAPRDLRKFNREMRRASWIGRNMAAGEAKFFGKAAPEASNLRVDRVEQVKQILLPYFVFCDQLAEWKQRNYTWSGNTVYAISPLAVGLMAASLIRPEWGPYFAAAQLVLLTITLILMGKASSRNGRDRWIESRFLAERCRSAIFLALAGMRVTPLRIPAHLTDAHPPNEWPVRVSQEIESRLASLEPLTEAEVPAVSAFLEKAWTIGQEAHHMGKAVKVARWYGRLTALGNVTLTVGVALTLVEILGIITGDWGTAFNLVCVLVPAIGATFTGMRQHGELVRIEARSYRLHLEFAKLRTRYIRVHGVAALQRLLRDMEEVTLRDVQDWYLLMRLANQFESPS